MDSRVGPSVTNPNQTMGMFHGEAYARIAELQIVLDKDPMQMEFVGERTVTDVRFPLLIP